MNENKKNEVILIGLPNSGKSTLINTLTNKKNSIIGSEPNTTRDKISTVIEINNKQITISDLPGFDENPDNCLLYTSPSPRDGRISRMPSSA